MPGFEVFMLPSVVCSVTGPITYVLLFEYLLWHLSNSDFGFIHLANFKRYNVVQPFCLISYLISFFDHDYDKKENRLLLLPTSQIAKKHSLYPVK